jgi:hypothetical protein
LLLPDTHPLRLSFLFVIPQGNAFAVAVAVASRYPKASVVVAVAIVVVFALLVIPEGGLLLSHRLLRSREFPHFALFALIRLYPFDHRYAFIRVHPRPSAVALLWPLKVLTELGTDFCHYRQNGSIRLTTLATLSTAC